MSKSGSTIDYLDLYLPVPAALQQEFQQSVERFVENHIYVEITPRIKDGLLLINSTDLVAFSGYIDPENCNELDLRRFKTAVKKQIEQQLVKSLSLNTQAHYKWCLASFRNKELGRYLDEKQQPAESD